MKSCGIYIAALSTSLSLLHCWWVHHTDIVCTSFCTSSCQLGRLGPGLSIARVKVSFQFFLLQFFTGTHVKQGEGQNKNLLIHIVDAGVHIQLAKSCCLSSHLDSCITAFQFLHPINKLFHEQQTDLLLLVVSLQWSSFLTQMNDHQHHHHATSMIQPVLMLSVSPFHPQKLLQSLEAQPTKAHKELNSACCQCPALEGSTKVQAQKQVKSWN